MPEAMPQAKGTRGSGNSNASAGKRTFAIRAATFFGLWLALLPSLNTADLVFGVFTTLAATWLSLQLSPPADGQLRFGALLLTLPHLLYESARGGVDVALRALAPRLPEHAGLFSYATGFSQGFARNTFASITSLLPGTLTCGEAGGELVYHGLDLNQPVIEQLREEERRLAGALVAGHGHE